MGSPARVTPRAAFLTLLLLALIGRAVVWAVYAPVVAPDTHGYVRLARQLQSGNLTLDDGRRTPVYPLFLLVAGLDYERVWLLQSALGIAVAAMLFALLLRRTGSSGWALLGSAVYALSVNEIFFEATIVTETLATFLLVLSVLLFSIVAAGGGRRRVIGCLLLGVVVGAASLTRPLLSYLAPVYLVFLAAGWKTRAERWERARDLGGVLVPVVLLILGWSAFNYSRLGYFGPTTLSGYNLTNHSGGFIELAPDRYATVRDIYLRYRARRVAETGSHSMTIWAAYPEMLEKTGLSFRGLSQELTRLSVSLYVRHPLLYLESVLRAAARFWMVAGYARVDAVRAPVVAAILKLVWGTERVLLLIVNVLFLLFSCLLLWKAAKGGAVGWRTEGAVIVAVIGGCVVQALVEYGENARYAIPFQPLILYTATVFAWSRVRYGRWGP